MAGFDPTAPPKKGAAYGNSPVASTTGPKPIGVPAGYKAGKTVTPGLFGLGTIAAGTDTYQVAPNYYTGDEYGSVPGFPTKMPDIAQLQQYLVQAGLLDDKKTIYGQWDAVSAKAFASILGSANQQGTDWQDTLAQRLTLADQQGLLDRQDTSTRAPLQVKYTNPEDLKATAQNVAQTLYGGNLSEDDLAKFVTSYQSMESQAQTTSYNQAPTGGAVTAPPDPSVAVESQIRADHPDQVAATQFGARMKDIIGTFTGNGT